jgi:hypothetical protein
MCPAASFQDWCIKPDSANSPWGRIDSQFVHFPICLPLREYTMRRKARSRVLTDTLRDLEAQTGFEPVYISFAG